MAGYGKNVSEGDRQRLDSVSAEDAEQRTPAGSDNDLQGRSGSEMQRNRNLDAEEQQLRARAEQLERIKALRSQIRQLQADSVETTPTVGRRNSDSSGSSRDLKIKNIDTFNLQCTLRKRDDWLADMKRAFDGAPKKFGKDKKKILFGLDNMDSECRARWDRYLALMT